MLFNSSVLVENSDTVAVRVAKSITDEETT